VAATVERFGRLDICVANAGVGSYHTLADTPIEHIEEMIDVNLKGTIYAIRACVPHLIASPEGDIVTLAKGAKGEDEFGLRAEFVKLVRAASTAKS